LIHKKIENFFFLFLNDNQKKMFEACNANQVDQPIMANGAWSTRRLNKYDWLTIS